MIYFLYFVFLANFSAGNWIFSFSLFKEYAMLLTVIILKKRGWILYPYSIFHAKIIDGFVHPVLSIIPQRNITIWLSDTAKAWQQSFGLFFGGTMDKTLTKYHNIFIDSKVLVCWRYQRFCKAFIHVIFADSSKGVCPVISLQYL